MQSSESDFYAAVLEATELDRYRRGRFAASGTVLGYPVQSMVGLRSAAAWCVAWMNVISSAGDWLQNGSVGNHVPELHDSNITKRLPKDLITKYKGF